MFIEFTGELSLEEAESLEWVSAKGRKTRKKPLAPRPCPDQLETFTYPPIGHHQVDSNFVGHQDLQELLVHSRLKS